MTTKELNAAIKKVCKKYNERDFSVEFEKEFKRVYLADSNFQYINPRLALNLIRINSARRYFPLHSFGIGYEVK